MAGDSDKEPVGDTASDVPALSDTEKTKIKKKKGLLSRMWNGIFRLNGEDFEKRLQYISKEEAAILSRMAKRSHKWRRMTRNLIIFSVLLEVVAVGYAIMTTRSLDLNWKMRALRVLPMFLLPGLSLLTYSGVGSFTRLRDRNDKNTLERLRAERQAKIDELKERTNYYTTQQLIQRYDPDPAAKAAAATVLASKLGADSGLKVYLGDESKLNVPTGKSKDVELVQLGGLRNRKHLHTRSNSLDSTLMGRPEVDMLHHTAMEEPETSQHCQMVVQHLQPPGSSTHDGSWLSRFAALLVGEDPSQSYALICGNCHMHNGLARKEDFPFITYYCPHCNALNQPKHLDEHVSGSNNQPKPLDEHVSGSNSPNNNSSITGGSGSGSEIDAIKHSSSSMVEKVSTSSPVAASADSTEIDKISS